MKSFALSKKTVMAIGAVIALVALLVAYRSISDRIAENRRRLAFDNLNATALNRIAELAVLEYRYTDVMELNRKFVVGGASTSLVRFTGIVKAGIPDVTKIQARFDGPGNTVRIRLPRAAIVDNTVDVSTVKIWDVRRNIFVPISTELKLQEVGMFKERIARELETSGFLAEADERAEELVKSMYAGFGARILLSRN